MVHGSAVQRFTVEAEQRVMAPGVALSAGNFVLSGSGFQPRLKIW
jgi:hypothetical protein